MSITLCIAFGTTQFEKQFGGPAKAFPKMREAATRLQGLFKDLIPTIYLKDPIALAAKPKHKLHFAYQQSAIFSLTPYNLNALPSEDHLVADFLEMVETYKIIVEDPLKVIHGDNATSSQ